VGVGGGGTTCCFGGVGMLVGSNWGGFCRFLEPCVQICVCKCYTCICVGNLLP
jgi:hypothetical protein